MAQLVFASCSPENIINPECIYEFQITRKIAKTYLSIWIDACMKKERRHVRPMLRFHFRLRIRFEHVIMNWFWVFWKLWEQELVPMSIKMTWYQIKFTWPFFIQLSYLRSLGSEWWRLRVLVTKYVDVNIVI